ncbi:hypothetical protein D3C78_365110 [compost metagenome]
MGPERDVVEGGLLAAEHDDVHQGDGLHVGVLQHGVGGVEFGVVADLVAGGLQHLQVEVVFELDADVQRDWSHIAGRSSVARLHQPRLQSGRSHLANTVVDLAHLLPGAGGAEAGEHADLVLAGRTGEPGGRAAGGKQQGAEE